MELEEVLKERINSSNIFNDKEKDIILYSISLYVKIYFRAFRNSKRGYRGFWTLQAYYPKVESCWTMLHAYLIRREGAW